MEDGRVAYERTIPTPDLAREPELLIDALKEAAPLDLIAGPSGYGVPITKLEDVDDPEAFALTALLLSRPEELEAAYARGEFGIMVYKALARAVTKMKEEKMPVCFVPGVIHLPTVPKFRKINKIDMSTADKLCITVLAVHNQAQRLGLHYDEVAFVLLELGSGYVAGVAVDEGVIVDGIGGTLGGPGFLTAGALDFELVQLVGRWERSDVFHGGAFDVSGCHSIEELTAADSEIKRMALEAVLEGVDKAVASLLTSVPNPREILLSGRLARIPEFEAMVRKRLAHYGVGIRRVGWLPGARQVKEAAQGYAMVADGLAGGRFADLVRWMRIPEASGTALDYLYHPKARRLKQMLDRWRHFWH